GTYDAATEDCAGADPAFATIQGAVSAAVDGDRILVCPGTYAEPQINVDKALVIESVAGAASTVIVGTGGRVLAVAGTARPCAPTGAVTCDGFTVQSAKAGPGNVRCNIRVGAAAPGAVFTVTNSGLIGTGNPADGSDYGLYAAGPIATETL